MTYHWIVPAPEFDSGAEKDLNNIFVAWASLPEQLSVHTAPTELYIFLLYTLQTYRSYRSSIMIP